MMNETAFAGDTDSLERVATGQKMVIYSIVLWLATPFLFAAVSLLLSGWEGPVVLLFWLGPYVLGVFGLLRVWSGMGYSELVKLFLLVLLLIPLVNVLVLLLINLRATRVLKAAGYSVGLLGVRGIPKMQRQRDAT